MLKVTKELPKNTKEDLTLNLELKGTEALLLAAIVGNVVLPNELWLKFPTLESLFRKTFREVKSKNYSLGAKLEDGDQLRELVLKLGKILDESGLNR